MGLLKSMVHQISSVAPGTGSIALPAEAASASRRTFLAAFGTGNPCFYYIEGASGSEWGQGTVTGTSTAVLTRDTVIGNSLGTTAKVNFTGVVNVWSGLPAEKTFNRDDDSVLDSLSGLPVVAGDILYGSGIDAIARLPKGTDGKVLTLASGIPSWAAPSGGRELLTDNRTYYVRTDGSNSNNGLTNASGGAFLTIQKAIDTAVALDLGIYAVTINVANGTYTTPVILKSYIGVGPISIVGNVISPSSVLISVTEASAILADTVLGKYVLSGIKLATSGSGYGMQVINGSIVDFHSLDFGATAFPQLYSAFNSTVTAVGNYSISGSSSAHWAANDGGRISVRSRTIALSGTPAYGTAFAQSARGGGILALSNTYSGSATGPRYAASDNGTIATGAATLPGNAAGSETTGGRYS